MSAHRPLHFNTFILTESDFSDGDQETILTDIKNPKNRKTLNLSLILIVWNIGGFFIESALIGGGILFLILKGINWLYFLPEFIFIIVNFSVKVIFTSRYLKDYICLRHTIYACIPSAGPLILLGILLHSNTLLIKAFRKYLMYRKDYTVNDIKQRIKKAFSFS